MADTTAKDLTRSASLMSSSLSSSLEWFHGELWHSAIPDALPDVQSRPGSSQGSSAFATESPSQYSTRDSATTSRDSCSLPTTIVQRAERPSVVPRTTATETPAPEGAQQNERTGIVMSSKTIMRAEQETLSLIKDLHEEEELKVDYRNMYNTTALVQALFMSFLVSLEGYSLEAHPNCLWNAWNDQTEIGYDLFHLSVGISLMLCFFGIFLTMTLLMQMGHLPKDGIDELFDKYGLRTVQGPTMTLTFMLYALGIFLMLLFSLTMKWWVGFVHIVLLAAGLCFAPLLTSNIVNQKMRVLRNIKRRVDNGEPIGRRRLGEAYNAQTKQVSL